jgi:3-deoxy-manno-octulosonate cytidylyltransferase (CMP-KDO synthetase)
MKIIGVIPARYESTRFPGKPLADIHGKPMVWWVYQQAIKVPELNEVYVATESDKIKSVCAGLGIPVVMTSDKHPTGTDRVAEVADKISSDLYVNIQGDEPLIEPETISAAIKPLFDKNEFHVVNLMARINNPVDAINSNIPKVIASENGRGLYLTRSVSPFPKGNIAYSLYRQVCVYAFTSWALEYFKNTPRGKIETIEDIEILRFIENGIYVKFIEVNSATIAVDTKMDLKRVQDELTYREQAKG